MGQSHGVGVSSEATQHQRRAAGQMLPVSAAWGFRDCKSSFPGRVVILLCASPKEQHNTCRGVQSTAFDVLQQLGNENKRSSCMGKLGQRKTSMEICWVPPPPPHFLKKKALGDTNFPACGWLRWGLGPLQGPTLRCLSYFGHATRMLVEAK